MERGRYYLNELFNRDIVFYNGLESFCFQNCLRILLEAKEIDNSFLYLDASLSLVYNFDEEGGSFNTDDNIRGFISQYSQYSRYYPKLTEDKLGVFKENIEYMAEHNEPIIVGVDTFYLPYATNYRKNHAIHTAILCGYNLDKEVVYLIDWYEPWCFKGEIVLEKFLQARNSENKYDGTLFSGQPVRNNWAKLELVEIESKKVLLKQLVQKTKDQYFNCESEIRGTEAIKKIIQIIQNKSDLDFKKLHTSLFTVSKRFNFFREWLIQYNGDEDETIGNMITILGKYVKEWDVLLILLVKQTRKMSERTNDRIVMKLNYMIALNESLEAEIQTII